MATAQRPQPKVMTLTDAAALRIRDIMGRAEKPAAGLRVGVKNGGCAGMEYTMEWAEDQKPFDEVVETAKRVAAQMPRELRCTALGGLSITKTSLAIEAKLAAKKSAACGAPSCGCSS